METFAHETNADDFIADAFGRLDEVALLPDNWDGYDAPAVSPLTVSAAKFALVQMNLAARAGAFAGETPIYP